MPEPKPMDPERLAKVRRGLAGLAHDTQNDLVAELIDDRDCWQSEHRRVAGVLARVREIAGAPGDEYTAEARKIELIREVLAGLDGQEPEA